MPPRKTTSRSSAPSAAPSSSTPPWLLNTAGYAVRPARSAAASSGPTTSSSTAASSNAVLSSLGNASSGGVDSAAPVVPKSQSISEHLEADPPIVPSEAFAMLLKLEKRPLPTMVSTDQARPATNPRCACFSTSSPAQWYAHNMCERCQLLNRVIQAAALNASSASYEALLSLSLLATDCVSETVDCHGWPLTLDGQDGPKITRTLPVELWQRVLHYAIAGSVSGHRIKQDGVSKLRMLMHTSSMSRLKVVELFSPLPMYEIEQVTGKTASKARVHNALTMYLLQRLQYFLLDPTFTRHRNTLKPVIPEASAVAWTSRGKVGTVSFSITIDKLVGMLQTQKETHEASVSPMSSSSATLKDACTALDMAFNKAGAAPRFAAPFLRVNSRRLDLTDVKGSIVVMLKLDYVTFKTWYFSPSAVAT